MAAAETYTPAPQGALRAGDQAPLIERFGYTTPMQAPRVQKITLNMGVGEAKTNAKALDEAVEQMAIIAGQKPLITKATKSIAGFKLREGMPIGCKVTLRGARMWEFLDRLTALALPRVRDFRGLNPNSFDGRGNYSMGVREQIIFPEIDYDRIDTVRGLDVTITTTAATDDEARELLGRSACRSERAEAHGQDVPSNQGLPAAEVRDPRVQPLQPLRPFPRGVQEVRDLPHLSARPRARRRHSRHDEVELVIARWFPIPSPTS